MLKRIRDARLAKGLCLFITSCKNPSRPGKTLCEECAPRAALATHRYRKNRMALGFCAQQGCPVKPENGEARCEPHLEEYRAYRRVYCAKKRVQKQGKVHQRRFLRKRKAQGICRYCTKPLSTQTYCEDHAAKVRARSARWRRKNGIAKNQRCACSNCGSVEHNIRGCDRPVMAALPDLVEYATARKEAA